MDKSDRAGAVDDPEHLRAVRLLEAVEIRIARDEGRDKAREERELVTEEVARHPGPQHAWKRAGLIVDAVADFLGLSMDRRAAICVIKRYLAGGLVALIANNRGFSAVREVLAAVFGLPSEELDRDKAALLDEAQELCGSYAEFLQQREGVLWTAELLRQAEHLDGSGALDVPVRKLRLTKTRAVFLDRFLGPAGRKLVICGVAGARPTLVVGRGALARFLARELTRPSSAPPPPALQDALLVVRAALAEILDGTERSLPALRMHDVAYVAGVERMLQELYQRRAAANPTFRLELLGELFGYFGASHLTAAGRKEYVATELAHLQDGRFASLPLVAAGLSISLLELCRACPGELGKYGDDLAAEAKRWHQTAGLGSQWERFAPGSAA